jgi:phosphate transport system protein
MTERLYIDKGYSDDLRRMRVQLIMMGGRVETLLSASVRALTERDVELAHQTVESDCAVEQHELAIDSFCRRILACRHLVASNLRFVTSSLRLATDLERIANLGVSIGQCALDLCALAPLQPEVVIPRMANEVESMLRDALDAFVTSDASKAENVIARDKLIDNLSAQIFCELLTHVGENAQCITQALRLQSVVKYLERVADHVTNLCETVALMVGEEDVCHAANLGDSTRAVPNCEGN